MDNDTEFETLEYRSGLPEAIRILIDKFPRNEWEIHPNFNELVRFWLDRHIGFRRMIELVQEDADKLEQQTIDPALYRNRLARVGSRFVSELHMHHNIEDQHYFPRLQKLETTLERGFNLLDSDHHELEESIERFTALANTALSSSENELLANVRALQDLSARFETFLNRHLLDEEDLIVPVILKHKFSS